MNMFGSINILIVTIATSTAPAYASDPAPTIPPAYEQMAALYEIPPDLFYAVALQESGRHLDSIGRVPWPWTLNVAGKGYYFDTKTEAWDALRRHIEQGATNIGIGLMQPTYPYNQYALSDVYGALDPATNLRLGAQIMRECYDRLADWWAAVGCYHSPGRTERQRRHVETYKAHVKRRLERISGARQ